MQTLRRIPYYGALALLAYMPFHIFLSQSLSLVTGGLEVWKVAKDFLTIALVLLAVSLVLVNKKLRQNKPFMIVFWLAFAYGLLHALVYFFNKDTSFDVALLASTYNNRLFWYFLIGAGAALLVGKKVSNRQIIKIVLGASTLVCLFALLQWVLPKDILTHLGYSVERGVRPIFFINDNVRKDLVSKASKRLDSYSWKSVASNVFKTFLDVTKR